MLFILKQYLKSNNVREITMVMTISEFIFITFMLRWIRQEVQPSTNTDTNQPLLKLLPPI